MHMIVAHAANTTRNHHRLVVSANPSSGLLVLEGAEVTVYPGPTKLVVETCRADGAFQHDIQCRDHMVWLTGF